MSETALETVTSQELINDVELAYQDAIERAPALAWPEQMHTREDGSNELRPPRQEYKLGNPNSVVAPHRERFLDAVSNNMATIVRSPTGTGKTTELTIALLESRAFKKILVTQPRIVAARSTTKYERSQIEAVFGEELARKLIGWHTAPDSDYDDAINMMVNLTDGIPVQQILAGDFDADGIVLVTDEVHEDKTNMHLLMLMAKVLKIRVVIMSATVDVDEKAEYLADEDGNPAPIIDIEGTTFPIEEVVFNAAQIRQAERAHRPNGSIRMKPGQTHAQYLEEQEAEKNTRIYRDAYTAAADYAHRGLDVLLFVTDIKDVQRVMGRLRARLPRGCTLLGLDGSMNADEQDLALRDYPGGKVVVATDIAMTSLTPNVDVVLDCGLSRTPRLNKGGDGLAVVPSSRAARIQRKGRCGRTKPGIHEMVQLSSYPIPLDEDELDAYDLPQICSERPDDVILKLAKLGLTSMDDLMAKPNAAEVELSVKRLRSLGAVALQGYYTGSIGELTEIGEKMVGLPLHAHSARMMAEAGNYSEAVQLQMAAAMAVWQAGGVKSPNMTPQQIRRYSKERDADLLVGLDLFIEAAKMSPSERREHSFSEARFNRAWTSYKGIVTRHLSKESDKEMDLKSPTDIERAQLHACMVSGIDTVYRAHQGGRLNDSVQKARKKTQDSLIWSEAGDLVAGTPYDIGRVRRHGYSTARLVTGAFRVDMASLREFTPERLEDRPRGEYRTNKHGATEQLFSVHFDGRPLGEMYWRPAESSPAASEFLLDHLFDDDLNGVENLPQSIREMRREHAELRALQDRTAQSLDLRSWVAQKKAIIRANMKEGVIDLSSIPSFSMPQAVPMVPRELRQEILAHAPEKLMLFNERTQEFVDVPVVYRDNVAYLTLSKELYPLLAAEIPELHGRKVMVRPVSSHKYVDQATAYEQRGARRDGQNRGNTTERSEKQRRHAERRAERRAKITSQISLAAMNQQTINYRRAGVGHAPRSGVARASAEARDTL